MFSPNDKKHDSLCIMILFYLLCQIIFQFVLLFPFLFDFIFWQEGWPTMISLIVYPLAIAICCQIPDDCCGSPVGESVVHWIKQSPVVQSIMELTQMVTDLDSTPHVLSLSDGGHTDNMAILPLLNLAKKPAHIVLADGEEDPDLSFDSLRYSLDFARSYFGIEFYGFNNQNQQIDANQCLEEFYDHHKNNKERVLRLLAKFPDDHKTNIFYVKMKPDNNNNNNRELCCYLDICCGTFPYHSTGCQCFPQHLFTAYQDLGEDSAAGIVNSIQ